MNLLCIISLTAACLISGRFQSEEDELDYLFSSLEIGAKTRRYNNPGLVGMYSYTYLYIILLLYVCECSRFLRSLPV